VTFKPRHEFHGNRFTGSLTRSRVDTPEPCQCGLFHDPKSHAEPSSTFTKANRCLQCVKLRCDAPIACLFPHRCEDERHYRRRLHNDDRQPHADVA
jgi:hypothetical protein